MSIRPACSAAWLVTVVVEVRTTPLDCCSAVTCCCTWLARSPAVRASAAACVVLPCSASRVRLSSVTLPAVLAALSLTAVVRRSRAAASVVRPVMVVPSCAMPSLSVLSTPCSFSTTAAWLVAWVSTAALPLASAFAGWEPSPTAAIFTAFAWASATFWADCSVRSVGSAASSSSEPVKSVALSASLTSFFSVAISWVSCSACCREAWSRSSKPATYVESSVSLADSVRSWVMASS